MAVNIPFGDPEAHGTFCDTLTWQRSRGKTSLKKKPRRNVNYSPSTKQNNCKQAISLLATSWKWESTEYKETWQTYGETINMTGYIAYTSRGMDEYVIQIETDTQPQTVSVSGNPPAENWTWT